MQAIVQSTSQLSCSAILGVLRAFLSGSVDSYSSVTSSLYMYLKIQMNPPSRSKPRSGTSGHPPQPKAAERKPKTRDESIKSKEEEYRRLNAELEAKTATLVKEAEELMKEHNSILMYQSDMPTDVNTADDNHSQPPLPEVKAQSDVGVPRPLSSAATTEPSMRFVQHLDDGCM